MKTALYEKNFEKTLNQRKLVRFIKNTIPQIFLLYSAVACSSSDNSTCAGFTVNCQIMLIQITFKTKEYGKFDLTTEQRKQIDYEYR